MLTIGWAVTAMLTGMFTWYLGHVYSVFRGYVTDGAKGWLIGSAMVALWGVVSIGWGLFGLAVRAVI